RALGPLRAAGAAASAGVSAPSSNAGAAAAPAAAMALLARNDLRLIILRPGMSFSSYAAFRWLPGISTGLRRDGLRRSAGDRGSPASRIPCCVVVLLLPDAVKGTSLVASPLLGILARWARHGQRWA